MAEKQPGLDLAGHVELAGRLSEMEAHVKQIRKTVTAAYGEPARSMTRQISHSLETLRSFLDTRVFVENPEREGAANGAVYYTGGRRGCGGAGGGCSGGCKNHPGDAPCAATASASGFQNV
ncbi:MAG: hypothetical protein ACLFPR_06840 [Desulfococcaceae bacterium]